MSAIKTMLNRFFGPENMLPKGMPRGELPSGRSMRRTYISMAIPSVVEMVLISLINMADTVMVSGIGTDAVAAVGLVNQPRFIMLCFFWALNTGVTAVIARRKGENRQEAANLALRNALIIAALLSVVICALFLPFSEPLMRFSGAEEGRTLKDAADYFLIIGSSLPFHAVSMSICAAQRGSGNTKLTMEVNITSNLVNILFNYLLINGVGPFPRLGVRGAAIASFIGIVVGFVLSVISLLRGSDSNRFLRLTKQDSWKLDREAAGDVLHIALSSLVENLCMRVGFFAYALIAAGLGTDAFAAHQIDMQFISISFSFADGLGIAGTALVGQMLGRKRKDLAFVYGVLARRISLAVSFLMAGCCILGRTVLVGWFINGEASSESVRVMAENIMWVVGAFQPFQMVAVVVSGALRGAGDVKYTAYVSAITVTLIRPILSLLAVILLKPYGVGVALFGVWVAAIGDMGTRMFLVLARYAKGKWQDIKV